MTPKPLRPDGRSKLNPYSHVIGWTGVGIIILGLLLQSAPIFMVGVFLAFVGVEDAIL